MPQIEIRPAVAADIPILVGIDHGYKSSHVWQMDRLTEESQIGVNFREIRLPRPVRVEYPRDPQALSSDWTTRAAVLVAVLNGESVGYLSLSEAIAPTTAWVTDLTVDPVYRRQGIASALVLAAQDFAGQHHNRRMILEMQSKNIPAVHLAMRLGYEFCGYNDHYYSNQDIALFFAQFLR
ncbi:MAG TPA: GNAT family N-acetyltransferase [Anaerolineaceae bacterium]|nr:GNAT family N-acetyltransferase [Anaerolineaceae bacterium]